MALLISGAYYLNIHTAANGSTFCGLDMKSEDGRSEIEKAIIDIVDFAYQDKINNELKVFQLIQNYTFVDNLKTFNFQIKTIFLIFDQWKIL